ncbi:hypothetical protein RIF29_23010 [Crotalaria pallida]|uniref:Chalcone-flavonone isomerase family protein n=1 Tax=Crotalaria pallida TaxID=3830 RepID=A0AAN9F5N6_CROPI
MWLATPSITTIKFDNLEFPAVVTPPGSSLNERVGDGWGLHKVYGHRSISLEHKAVASLAPKWKKKSSQELTGTLDFFRDIISEAAAIDKFAEAFKNVNFPPGASLFYRQSPDGILGLRFSQDDSIPENEAADIVNMPVSSAVLETMIGEHAVSPALKRSLAARLPALILIERGYFQN